MSRLDAVRAVLDHEASRWCDAGPLRGEDEEIGKGLPSLNMVTRGDDVIGKKLDKIRCRDAQVHPLR